MWLARARMGQDGPDSMWEPCSWPKIGDFVQRLLVQHAKDGPRITNREARAEGALTSSLAISDVLVLSTCSSHEKAREMTNGSSDSTTQDSRQGRLAERPRFPRQAQAWLQQRRCRFASPEGSIISILQGARSTRRPAGHTAAPWPQKNEYTKCTRTHIQPSRTRSNKLQNRYQQVFSNALPNCQSYQPLFLSSL